MLSRRFLAVVVLAGAGLAAPPPALAAKDYRAVHYNVRLAVEPGGSMLVTETVRFAFGDDTFSYVSRELPSRRTDGLTVLAAWMDGRELTRGDGPGQYEVRRQDQGGRRVRWHFEKRTASEHTFTLMYRVHGVVRYAADADLLEWWALPTSHEYAIDCATVAVTYPATAVLAGVPAVAPAPVAVWPGSGPVAFERCGFGKNDSWLVRMAFAPRSIVPALPDWQRRAEQAQRKRPALIGLAAMILIAGAGAFVVFGLNQRSPVTRDAHGRATAPPDTLPVVLGAALARKGRATWNPALATIFDMARRGVVRIEELPAGRLESRDFLITDAGRASALHPVERTLHDVLFTTKSGPRTALKFSDLGGLAGSSRWKRVGRAVRTGLKAEGLIDADRVRTRSRATRVAVCVIVLGVVGLMAAIPLVREHGGATLLPGAALAIAGLIGLGVAQNLTLLTDEALRRSAGWQAYGRHLKDLSGRISPTAVTPDLLDRTLPAAVAFGAGSAWAKALHKEGLKTGPTWLQALPRDGADADHMSAALHMLSSGHAAGSHGGQAGAGAAAAAGGGSSSAG